MEFGLFCDKKIISTVITSLTFVSFFVGAGVAGQLADKFGRYVPVLSLFRTLNGMTYHMGVTVCHFKKTGVDCRPWNGKYFWTDVTVHANLVVISDILGPDDGNDSCCTYKCLSL